jgi:hypothetical protein
MNQGILTIDELLAHPNLGGLVNQEEAEKIVQALGQPEETSAEPLYLRLLVGTGAWFSAAFLIFFLGLSGIIDNGTRAIIVGVILLVAAATLVHLSKAAFLQQLSLALAFAGNILVALGPLEAFSLSALTAVLLAHTAVCTVMYPLYPSSTYRFLAPTALAAIATGWIIDQKVFVLIHLLIAGEMLLAGFLLLRQKHPPLLLPLTYAATAMLPATLLFMNLTQMHLWRTNFNEPLWPSSLLLTAGLLILFLRLARKKHLADPWMLLAFTATVLLGIFTTPGILVAIALLILGHALGDRILTMFALLFFSCFLVVFYYALNIDLAYKSYVVAGSGLLLLVVRHMLNYLQPKEEQG